MANVIEDGGGGRCGVVVGGAVSFRSESGEVVDVVLVDAVQLMADVVPLMMVVDWQSCISCHFSSACVSTIGSHSACISVEVGVAELGVAGLDLSYVLYQGASSWGQGSSATTQVSVPWWPAASAQEHQSCTVHLPQWCEIVLHLDAG